jgi:very-short-patch-repair endonuclease
MAAELSVARRVHGFSRAQNGAIKIEQLLRAGLTRSAIRSRVAHGRLVPLFYGVYGVGDPELVALMRPSGALLSIGESAVLSHRSAAAVWGLAQPDPQVIDVTVIASNPKPREGVRIHRVKQLRDTTTHQNLPITTPARTMIDFASQASSSELADAFGEARAKCRLTDAKLNAALKRAPRNHPGAAVVRRMLSQGGTHDRSKAERLMRKLCRQAELPQPLTNIILHGHLVDFLWPDQRLIIEVDGYDTHGNRQAFENDRRRDQTHTAAGYVVIRITWRHLQHEPIALAVRIAQALTHRAA